jgi:thiol:disulfide interchange protein DsbD
MQHFFLTLVFLGSFLSCQGAKISFQAQQADDQTTQIKLFFELDQHEILYKDSLQFSVDSPSISLSDWHATIPAINRYDESLRETKAVFNESFSLILFALKHNETEKHDSYLYLTYQLANQDNPQQEVFQLYKSEPTQQKTAELDEDKVPGKLNQSENSPLKKQHAQHSSTTSWYDYFAETIKKTDSFALRLLIVLLLGILLSFTPCIYPMIPITVGILHAQKSSSLFYNFLLSLAYTFGISTTFALFGLLAGYTGPLYGKLLVHPVTIALLTFFLVYLGCSMLGLYDMYIPSFIASPKVARPRGSLVSTFLFGAASGTIASPCVSPGLILLLSIVATMGNLVAGFILLFVFGIGLSLPLLLVGTFSSSMNLLPRAGLWMIEIKRLFGILLIVTALYFLHNVLPLFVVLVVGSIIAAFLGIFYVHQGLRMTGSHAFFNTTFGFIALIVSVLIAVQAVQKTMHKEQLEGTTYWIENYQEAVAYAQKNNTLLLLDFWADYCSICKAINNTLLKNQQVTETLKELACVSINASQEDSNNYQELKQTFKIVGFPTILLVDPMTKTIIKEWHSELYGKDPAEFIEEIKSLLKR